MEHTLPILLFFKQNLTIYINLVSKFLVSCDYKGVYSPGEEIPDNYFFDQDAEDNEMIKNCKLERNSENWFMYCKPICTNF